ncbi:MAG: hypothetical protein K6G88_15275 [Lachnospiraceae bacterium]|nr:hypothetical protein [Lachnospiraceae bacterium]
MKFYNTRDIERKVYNNPILDEKDYPPPLSKEEREFQRLEVIPTKLNEDTAVCNAYVRKDAESWFIDAYFFYNFSDMLMEERFVIKPGYQMPDFREHKFLKLIDKSSVWFNSAVIGEFETELEKVAPELNIKHYFNLSTALFHTYFASFRSGVRELLVKAGLSYIALNLRYMTGWNMMAQNIEEAFGMSVTLLRKFNYRVESEKDCVIATADDRQLIAMLYRYYHSLLNDIETLNELQILYLKDCLENDETVEKRMLRFLGELDTHLMYDRYIEDDYVKYEKCYYAEAFGEEYCENICRYDDSCDFDSCEGAYIKRSKSHDVSVEGHYRNEEAIILDFDAQSIYTVVKDYYALCDELEWAYKLLPKTPNTARYINSNFNSFYELYFFLQKYMENEDEMEQKMRKYYNDKSRFIYDDGKFGVFVPHSIKGLLNLYKKTDFLLFYGIRDFIHDTVEGRRTELYMTDKSKKFFIKMFVVDNYLYCRINGSNYITDEQRIFIKKFAMEKGLESDVAYI